MKRGKKYVLTRLAIIITVLLGLVSCPNRVNAATVTWDGDGNGTSWNDPNNWNTNSIPTAVDDVVIDANSEVDFSDSDYIDQATNGVASGSFSGDENLLFNNIVSDSVDSGATGAFTVSYDLGDGVAKTAVRYTVRAGASANTDGPKQWSFQGSHDGSSWITIDNVANQTGWSNYSIRTYSSFSNPENINSYRYYRWTDIRGQGTYYWVRLSELELLVEAPDFSKTINALTLGNSEGTSNSNLIFQYDAESGSPLTISTDLTVNEGASITHAGGSSVKSGSINIIVGGNAVINGTVNANAKGFASSEGDGQGGDGNKAGGGGHGGEGGNGTTGIGGGVYGSITEPISWGSGGGKNSTYLGGAGGGAIKMSVNGTLNIGSGGAISANGGNNISYYGGGGAGGSIYINTGTITGLGAISANGGIGDGNEAGAGGGGRIAIYYTTESEPAPSITAYGGNSGGGRMGGAGTIFKKSATQSNGTLVIDNNGYYSPLPDYYLGRTIIDENINFDSLIIRNYGNLATGVNSDINFESIEWSDSGIITDLGGSIGILNTGVDLTVPFGGTLYANSQRTLNNVTVDGTVTHSSNAYDDTYKIDWTIQGDLTVNGSIDVSSRGRKGSEGDGQGGDGGSKGGGGGGYGGTGGRAGGRASGGGVYGSITEPTASGSGGGQYNSDYYGGSGGGAIKLSVTGNITINSGGSITSNGQRGPKNWAGGGSGGSVYLATSALGGEGTISANGGNGYGSGEGGGGGGRIAIYYATEQNPSPTITSYGGTGWGFGGAGTIYLKDTSSNQDRLVIDNNNKNQTDDFRHGKTAIKGNNIVSSLIIRNYGNIWLDNGDSISYESLDWSNKGIITDNGGILAAVTNGGDLYIPETATLFSNVDRTYHDVTVVGTLTHSNNFDSESYKLDWTITGDLTVSGSISVNGRGYLSSEGLGQGEDGSRAGGGAHGGNGGRGRDRLGGTSYGSLESPVSIGSGGGVYQIDTPGGAGGGGDKTDNIWGTNRYRDY